MSIRVSLDFIDFNALVHGRVAVAPVIVGLPDGEFGAVVEIRLQDIGFSKMKSSVADAEEQSAKEDSSSHPAGS